MTEYRCPGERYAISRAVHLGRLARFYPGCRNCKHRHDTGTLSQRQAKRLSETEHRGHKPALFQTEEVGGGALGTLVPGTAHDLAAALGICLARGLFDPLSPSSGAVRTETHEPAVVVAGDGRPAVAELVAAACKGLRWAGCNVVDLGPASSACLLFAADHLGAAGGLLVGSGQGGPHRVGLKLFGPGSIPFSHDRGLDVVQRQFEQGVDRPTRRFGGLRRFQSEGPYLDLLRPHYHAIRPLRFVLDNACRPVEDYLNQLIGGLACRAVAGSADGTRLSERVVAEEAHFGLHIDDDGERCRAVDERGREVEPGRLLRLIARRLVGGGGESAGTIVVPRDIEWPQVGGGPDPPCTVEVVRSEPTRAAMAAVMRRSEAACGGTPDGRIWYGTAAAPLPDALHTLTHLLALLSRSDRPFSMVLDREAPCG
ncbi:MAG: hypothetical protein RBS80_05240 [Thermoguttaceae bacterium]|jgi:phosphomannomutase|nr:hypothetical protein [Thermoguttaceae bacterium]